MEVSCEVRLLEQRVIVLEKLIERNREAAAIHEKVVDKCEKELDNVLGKIEKLGVNCNERRHS